MCVEGVDEDFDVIVVVDIDECWWWLYCGCGWDWLVGDVVVRCIESVDFVVEWVDNDFESVVVVEIIGCWWWRFVEYLLMVLCSVVVWMKCGDVILVVGDDDFGVFDVVDVGDGGWWEYGVI